STVFARLSSTANNRCYRIEWRNPSNVAVQTTDFNPTNGNDDDSFNISASGPSGVWTVNVYESTNNNGPPCNFSTIAFSRTFDVAKAVIIGAVPSGGVGGDNFVDQSAAGIVQGVPPGGGLTLDIDSKTSSQNKRVFARFDLIGASIPATVTSAKLRMLLTSAPNNSRTHEARRALSTWLDSTITWNIKRTPGWFN